MSEYVDSLTDLVAGRTLPEGTDTWSFRTRSAGYGFAWPSEGWVDAPGPVLDHDGVTPQAPGDGLCVAFTWAGMATAPLTADGLLLVAFAEADRLSPADDPHTARLRRCFVVTELEGRDVLAQRSLGVDLRGARAELMDLTGACFFGADLTDAMFKQTKLIGASLYGATLTRANLQHADLRGADLRYASLAGANLAGAQVDHTTRFGHADVSSINAAHVNLFAADWS